MSTWYVDELLIAGKDITEVTFMKRRLARILYTEDCRKSKYCLGLEIIRDHNAKTVNLSHKNYAENILQRFDMDDCSPVQNQVEMDALHVSLLIEELYRKAIRVVLSLMVRKRADICFTVSCL